MVLGLVFLVTGFVQQGYQINFESGFFNLGLFFTLGDLLLTFYEENQVTARSDSVSIRELLTI